MTAPLTTRLTEPALDAASVACAWCGRLSVTNCLICSGRVCAECVRLSAAGQHMCRKCYRDAVEYAADRVAELNATALMNTRFSLSPVRFFHEVIARLEMWLWAGRWMLRAMTGTMIPTSADTSRKCGCGAWMMAARADFANGAICWRFGLRQSFRMSRS